MRGDTRALIDTGAPLGSVRTGVLQGCSTAFRNARTSPRQGSSQLAFFRAALPPSGTPVAPGRPNVPFKLGPGGLVRAVVAGRLEQAFPRCSCHRERGAARNALCWFGASADRYRGRTFNDRWDES